MNAEKNMGWSRQKSRKSGIFYRQDIKQFSYIYDDLWLTKNKFFPKFHSWENIKQVGTMMNYDWMDGQAPRYFLMQVKPQWCSMLLFTDEEKHILRCNVEI